MPIILSRLAIYRYSRMISNTVNIPYIVTIIYRCYCERRSIIGISKNNIKRKPSTFNAIESRLPYLEVSFEFSMVSLKWLRTKLNVVWTLSTIVRKRKRESIMIRSQYRRNETSRVSCLRRCACVSEMILYLAELSPRDVELLSV